MPESTITALPLSFFQLRVLIWKDRNVYVAQCLETGSVATADDVDTVKSIIHEVLTDEINYHVNERGTTRSMCNAPAHRERWAQYYELSRNRNPDLVNGVNMLDGSY